MFNVHISQRITLNQGDLMDAVYIVTKGSVRLDVNATSDAYTFIRNTLTHQFGHMTTDEIHTLLSASSLDAAAAALIRRFVPVTQLTHSREVHPYFPAQCFIPVFGYNAYSPGAFHSRCSRQYAAIILQVHGSPCAAISDVVH